MLVGAMDRPDKHLRQGPPFARIVANLGDRLSVLPYVAAATGAHILAPRVAEALARIAARVAYMMRVPARRQLERNLTEALRVDRGAALHAFENFALSFVDFLRLDRIAPHDLESRIVVDGREHYDAARASGRGVIVLSAHTGNWEWGAAYLAASVPRIHLVARAHKSGPVERFFARRRAAWGVSRLRGKPLWVAAAAALRRSEWVAMMGDRPAAESHGSLCGWATALARRTGSLVLPATMMRLPDGRYIASFQPAMEGAACSDQRWWSAIAQRLRRAPEQWFAFEPLPRTPVLSAPTR
jgi:KDO2-lipid IV(A) lauroyltransferase